MILFSEERNKVIYTIITELRYVSMQGCKQETAKKILKSKI